MNLKKLLGNVSVALIAQLIALIISLVTTVFVPKVLGIESFGFWQLFLFYSSYSGVLSFGLNDGVYLINGGVKRNDLDKDSIVSQFIVGIVSGVIISLAMIGISIWFVDSSQRLFVLVSFAIYTLFYNASCFLGFLFQAMNETKLFSYSTMVDRVGFFIPLIFLLVFRVEEFYLYIIFYIVAKSVSLTYCLYKAKNILSDAHIYAPKDSIQIAISSAKVGIKLMIANLSSMLILGVARLIIDSVWGIETFGKLSLVLSMVNFFLLFVSQVSMVLFPALRLVSQGQQEKIFLCLRHVTSILFPVVYLFCLPVIFVVGYWLPQYQSSLVFFIYLLPICVFDAKTSLCSTTYLKVLRKESGLLAINLVSLSLSFIISIIGGYVLHSILFIVYGMLISVIVRCVLAESYVSKQFKANLNWTLLELILLTAFFIFITLKMQNIIGWALMLIVYLLYVMKHKQQLMRYIRQIRECLV